MNGGKDLQRVLAGMKINKAVRVTAAKALSQYQILNPCPVQLYGLKSLKLLNTRATPNLLSTGPLKNIGVRSKPTNREITMASGDYMNCKGVPRKF